MIIGNVKEKRNMGRELLFSVTKKDLDISFFSGTGKGGQNRNKHQNCVRMQHKESGVMITAQRERSREQNLRIAFESLIEHPKFKTWHRKKTAELMASKEEIEREKQRLEDLVNEAMKPENIKIEVKDENGNWYAELKGDL